MNRDRLYKSILFLSLVGSVWTVLNLYNMSLPFLGCLFYKLTGLPCPACGSTRSVTAFLFGDYRGAFTINPLGLLTSFCMIIACIWICKDYLFHSDSFYKVFQKIKLFVQRRSVAFVLIFLLLANWLWNITKQL